jgi:type VI secretion system protein ImpH
VAERLFEEGYNFDFFQAVRLLEKLDRRRRAVGLGGHPKDEIVRFRAHLSLSFPPSSIFELQPPTPILPMPAMVVTFMGLTGPSGVLPRHYTELMLRLDREVKGPERYALRAWLDQFNHRLISLFYRAWEKYRFYIPYERGEYIKPEPDAFTRALFSLVGVGLKPLRNRLCISAAFRDPQGYPRERRLAAIDDFSLLYYCGYLSHRPRCALVLQTLLRDYYQLPIDVKQFQGQWLRLDSSNQSQVGTEGGNNLMGVNLVAGDRVWDVQNKIRIRLGPLRYAQFTEFLPDRSPGPRRKAFFLLAHLIRLYIGPELDFDVQLILRAEEVPPCRLALGPAAEAQLGWNTWSLSRRMRHNSEDAVFEGEEVRWLTPGR